MRVTAVQVAKAWIAVSKAARRLAEVAAAVEVASLVVAAAVGGLAAVVADWVAVVAAMAADELDVEQQDIATPHAPNSNRLTHRSELMQGAPHDPDSTSTVTMAGFRA